MSNLGIFLVGTLVTLIVLSALGLLVWGAIMDGRYNDEHRVADEAARGDRPGRPVNAA